MASQMYQVLIPRNCTFYLIKIVFADMIEDLDMGGIFLGDLLGLKEHGNHPYKREEERLKPHTNGGRV